ncbi:MAG: hypothetical protein ACD_64C00003G0001 [uncultured bacterium]|nr:MAG: hypothetical protein ACD_64C00003G0001 [uncultured bacterium]
MKRLTRFLLLGLMCGAYSSGAWASPHVSIAHAAQLFQKKDFEGLKKLFNSNGFTFSERQTKSIQLITRHDSEGLKKMSARELHSIGHEIELVGKYTGILQEYPYTFTGKLKVTSKNMLFFVLFNALANKSHKDTAVTLEMIDILVQKGVSLNQSCTCVLQIEAYTHDQKAHGSAELSYAMSLVELACYINSPEALEKLLQAGALFDNRLIDVVCDSDRYEVIGLLAKYQHQGR